MPRTAALVLAAVLAATSTAAAAGCGSGRGSGGSGTTSTAAAFAGAAYPPGVRAPGFALPDIDGRTVSLAAQRGRVVVLTFVPGGCRTCLLVAQQIRGALDELPATGNLSALFVSTAPRADSRARARGFLARTALLGRASYLLADERRLRPVWRAYHVTPPAGAGQTAVEDAIAVLLIDRQGLERVGYGLEQLTPEALAHDIRLLQRG